MKLIDGIKIKGEGVEIPDCNRNDLPGFFREMGFKVGVEIGVDKGSFSRVICTKKELTLYGVDPWLDYDGYIDTINKDRAEYNYKTAQRRLAPYKNFIIVRKTSMEAVNDFVNESLDFVYIDGNHGFKFVTEDIYEWSKKVKKGGVISGHDFGFTSAGPHSIGAIHVKYVLPAYTKAFGISDWYILGEENVKDGERRDRFRSWMWINK